MVRKYDELLAGRIFIGGEADAEEVLTSGQADVVFDVRVNGREGVEDAAYVHMPITEQDTALSIKSGAQQIKKAYEKGRNIYIHCGSGGGRAGVVSVAVLQEIGEAQNLAEAIDLVKDARPTIEIRPNMQQALEVLYK